MADTKANEYLRDNYETTKGTEVKIDNTKKATATDKLTGDLVIDDYPELKEIELDDNEITSLIITKCPKLETINIAHNKIKILDFIKVSVDGSGEGTDNNIEEITAGHNELERLEIIKCVKLQRLYIPNNSKLTKIKGNTSHINEITTTGTPAEFVTSDDLKELKDIKNTVKELLGDGTTKAKIPIDPATGKVDLNKLKGDLIIKGSENPSSPVQIELDAIKAVLELEMTATKDQILEAIQRLKDAGSGNNYISKTYLVESSGNSLKGLGISESDINKLGAAASARDVETSRNELINNQFDKLQNKLKYAHYLNAGLGTFSALVLLILV